MSAIMMVRADRLDVDPSIWTPAHLDVIRAAAEEPSGRAHLRQCRDQEGAVPRSQRRPRLAAQGASDVRPRLSLPYPHPMPARQRRLRGPAAALGGEGCSAGDLAYWFKDSIIHPKPPEKPPKPRPPMTLAQLPAACKRCWRRRTRSHSRRSREPFAPPRQCCKLSVAMSGRIVNPPDCRNGASACRFPLIDSRTCACAKSAATTHGAPRCIVLPAISSPS